MWLQEESGLVTIRLVSMLQKYISSRGALDPSQTCGNQAGRIKLVLTLQLCLVVPQWDRTRWEDRNLHHMRTII